MRPATRIPPLIAAVALTITACGSDNDPDTAPSAPADVDSITTEPEPEAASEAEPITSETPDDAPSPEPEDTADDRYGDPVHSERGNLIKELGQYSGLGEPPNTYLEFVVNSIEVDGDCTADYSTPPENGHYIIVELSVSTSTDLHESTYGDASFHRVIPEYWKIIDEEGITENGATDLTACLDSSDELPSSIGPGENARGKIAIDSANETGTLVFSPDWVDGGWEWAF